MLVVVAYWHIIRKGVRMPTYISLMKFTEQGIKDVKNTPQRTENLVKGLEAMGGKLIALYATIGEYDLVAIAEGPSDEVAMTFLLTMGSLGNIRTTTLKAFTREEFEAIVKRLP
jgi:uncharacterized protein with GYD domain